VAVGNDNINDKIKESHDARPDRTLPNVDRLALLQEKPKPLQKSTANLHDFHIDGLDDPEAKARGAKPKEASPKSRQDTDTPEGSNDKPAPKAKPGDPPVENARPKPDHAAAQPSETEIVGRTGNNPKEPTVAFIDEFQRKSEDLGLGLKVAHGEISRAAAEHNGFNTVALENTPHGNLLGPQDFSKPLNDVAKKIDDGLLKLGKGDVVNISLGNDKDPSFTDFNKFLGLPADKLVTADNLADRKLDILRRVKDISNDPSRNADDRAKAKRIVDTNQAIANLEARGIQVLHAAGNDRSDHFSPDFMNATELSSVKPSGTPDDFSASNSITRLNKGANGVFPLHIRQDIDLSSANGKKISIELGDTGVKFPVTGLASSNNEKSPEDNRVFDRENYKRGQVLGELRPDHVDASTYVSRLAQPLRPGQVAAEGQVIGGTSFVNIDFLKAEKAELEALKASRK